MTTMVTGADVPRNPVASKLTAVRRLVPEAALVQVKPGLAGLLGEGYTTRPMNPPLTRNSTFVTPLGEVVPPEMATFTGPLNVEPLVGLKIWTRGVPMASKTVMKFPAEVPLAPSLSLAMA